MRFAIPNHPWMDEKEGAAVRIAMTVVVKGRRDGTLLTVTDVRGGPDQIEFVEISGAINSDLRIGFDVTRSAALKYYRMSVRVLSCMVTGISSKHQ